MPSFFDWFNAAGAFAQTIFAWAGYNRDGFADNVAYRQTQMYQQKNYHLAWIAVARDDIRDMMGISVMRLNNYLIVATLIMSVTAGAFMAAGFPVSTPSFVIFAFHLSLGVSLIFLMLAIMFGVRGQNLAFTSTMQLLTNQVRPENPAEYSHDYMKQTQWIERQGFKGIFRIPGVMPLYGTDTKADHLDKLKERVAGEGWHLHGEDRPSGDGAGAKAGRGKVETALETLEQRTPDTWYLTKFARFMRLWHPYDTHSKYSMGLGIIGLGHGGAYFALGMLVDRNNFADQWAPCVLVAAFLFLTRQVVVINFKLNKAAVRYCVYLLLMIGPVLATVAAATTNAALERTLVPVAFVSHAFLWALCYGIALGDVMSSHLFDEVVEEGKWSWNRQQRRTPPQSGGRETAASGARTAVTAERRRDASLFAAQGAGELRLSDGSDHWPTDEPSFEFQVAETERQVKASFRSALLVSSFLWLLMAVWAVLRASGYTAAAQAQAGGGALSAVASRVEVQWPMAFQPISLTRAGDASTIFAADRFRIYEISLDGAPPRLRDCNLSLPIVDIAASCDSTACRPVALVHDQGAAQVVTCDDGRPRPLLRDDLPAQFFSLSGSSRELTENVLVTARGGQMVQFRWSASAQGWVPDWFLGDVGFLSVDDGADGSAADGPKRRSQDRQGPRGLSVVGDYLLLFREDHPRLPALERRVAATLAPSGRWRAGAAAPLAAGCALDGLSAVVLRANGAGESELYRLELS